MAEPVALAVRAPMRVQRQRAKGWKKPEGAVVVTRPGRWGNPFKGEDGAATMTRQLLVDDFRFWLMMPTRTLSGRPEQAVTGATAHLGVPYEGRPTLESIRAELAGRDLVCWCPIGQPCHADVLLEVANA